MSSTINAIAGSGGGGGGPSETPSSILAKLNISGLKFINDSYNPLIPSLATFSGNGDIVASSPDGQVGITQNYKYDVSTNPGTYPYIKGESIYLETTGTLPDPGGELSITGHEVEVSNYNTPKVYEIYGYGSRVNLEWPADYAYGGFFSATPGSVNASNGLPFVCGVSAHTGFGHHANTGRSVAVEAVIESSPSNTMTTADEVIGVNVWGVANNNCTATSAYGVYIESFTKGGNGTWGSIYGVHANADTFNNTTNGWFLHSLSTVPSLLSGPLQFASMASEPASPPAGRMTLFSIMEGGKVTFKVKFPTGTAQRIAQEI